MYIVNVQFLFRIYQNTEIKQMNITGNIKLRGFD